MNTSHPKRINALDGLRGLAALGIAAFYHYSHLTTNQPFKPFLNFLYQRGDVLVDLFFVVSGYTFAYVYQERVKRKSISLANFINKRVARLYPLHLITLLVVASGQSWYKQVAGNYFIYADNSVVSFIKNFFLIHYGWGKDPLSYSFNGPSWTIALEMIAYFFFFISLGYQSKIKPILIYIGFIVLSFVLMPLAFITPFVSWQLAKMLVGFFAGASVYSLMQWIKSKDIDPQQLSIVALVVLVCGFIWQVESSLFFIYPLLIFPSVLFLALEMPGIKTIFKSKALGFLGKISYSIYLWHFPLQLILVLIASLARLQLPYHHPLFWLGYVFLLISLSTLSYNLIERPLQMRLINNFKTKAW